MRTRVLLLLILGACARPAPYGEPVRLVSGGSDTLVVNTRGPAPLNVRALDASGRTVRNARIEYALTGGDSLPLTADGVLTCAQPADLAVRATLGSIRKGIVVRCRPVEWLRVPGPVQFVLGDSALGGPRAFPVTAYGPDAKPVSLIAGTLSVRDAGVARFDGLALAPLTAGATLASASIGGRFAYIGVHVYRQVGELGALDTIMRIPPAHRLVAVPLHVAPGEMRRQRLPRGGWLITMLPENGDSLGGPQLRVEHAECSPVFGPRHYACTVGRDAAIVVYRSVDRTHSRAADAQLLVRWFAGQ